MIDNVLHLISLNKPSHRKYGKIIIYTNKDHYETHFLSQHDQHDQLEVLYSGNHADGAWLAAEEKIAAMGREGFHVINPLFVSFIRSLPRNFRLQRKMECYCAKHKDDQLFMELKNWRKNHSAKLRIPPYFIATDKLLQMISSLRPQTLDELVQLPGIGRSKMDQYGNDILGITTNYPQQHPFPLDWIEGQVSDDELMYWFIEEKMEKTRKEEERLKREKDEQIRILECIQGNLTIEESAKKLAISIPNLIKRIQQLGDSGYDVVSFLKGQVERIEDHEAIQNYAQSIGMQRLKPIFEKLYGSGENMPQKEKGERYNQIRLVCTYLQLKSA